jgi:hypothetical protein
MVKFTKMLIRKRKEEGKKVIADKLPTRWGWALKFLRGGSTDKDTLDYTFIENDFEGSHHGQIPRVVSYGNAITEDTLGNSEQDLILADLQKLEKERIKILNRFSSRDGGPQSSKDKRRNRVAEEIVGIRSPAGLFVGGDGASIGSAEILHNDGDDASSFFDTSLRSHRAVGSNNEDDSQSCSSLESGLIEKTAIMNSRSDLIDALFIASSSDDDTYSDESSQDHDSLFDGDREILRFLELRRREQSVMPGFSTSLFTSSIQGVRIEMQHSWEGFEVDA